MIYTVDPNADEPIMLINKHIGEDENGVMGIDGAYFQQELLTLDGMGKKRIQVYINSVGGNVMEGYNIFSAILKTKTPVDTYCVGIAASIAGVIFMAGRKRCMADYAMLMIHPPAGSDDKKALDAFGNSLVKMLTSKSGITEQHVKYLMDRTSWLSATECLEKGFCTEIEQTKEQNRKNVPVGNQAAIMAYADNIFNSFKINNSNQNSNTMFPKVTMKLKLNDAATEDNVVSAIDAIENRAYKAETSVIEANNKVTEIENASKKEKADMESSLNKMKKDLEDKTAEYNSMKAAFDAMKTDKETAEKAENTLKCKNMVEGYAKAGRIKNDATTILKWSKLAEADFAGTEDMIKELPLNKDANVIKDIHDDAADVNKIQGTAMFKMLEIANRKKKTA